jgi:hypothetical protein
MGLCLRTALLVLPSLGSLRNSPRRLHVCICNLLLALLGCSCTACLVCKNCYVLHYKPRLQDISCCQTTLLVLLMQSSVFHNHSNLYRVVNCLLGIRIQVHSIATHNIVDLNNVPLAIKVDTYLIVYGVYYKTQQASAVVKIVLRLVRPLFKSWSSMHSLKGCLGTHVKY